MVATKETDLIREEMALIMEDDPLYIPQTPIQLVEDVAGNLEHDEWLDDPEHEVWELALEWFDSGWRSVTCSDSEHGSVYARIFHEEPRR